MRAGRLLTTVAFALSLLQTSNVWGQCANDNTLSGSAITVACPGSISGGCILGGRYALVNVTTGNIYTFSVCTASWNTHMTLFNNAGGANVGFNDDACNGNRSAVQWTATFTGQLRVLVDRQNCTPGSNPCAPLWITCSLNDDPCTSTLLTVGASCTNTVGSNDGATAGGVANPSCGGYAGGDVWYRFVAPASGRTTISTSTIGGSSLTNGAMAVYSVSSTCSSTFTEISCNDNSPLGGNMPYITLTGLTSGNTYYVRFWENGNDAFGTFNICAFDIPPPANDDPCAATSLTVGTSCTNTTATNVSATNTAGIPAPSCGSYSGGDVWFTAVAPSSGQLVLTTSTVGGSSLTDAAMALYSATACGGTYTEIACNDNSPLGGNMPYINASGLSSGTTYYVRVWDPGNNVSGQFNICATTPTAASNNDPCAATALTVASTCTNTTSTTAGASNTAGIPAPSCGNYMGSDVWFTAVAPANGKITLTTSTVGGSSLTDAAMAVYAASSCGAAMTEVGCNDNSVGNMPVLALSGLTSGTTYYVRIWGYGNTAYGQFNICATTPPVNDDPCAATSLTVGTSCTNTTSTNVSATSTSGIPAPSCGSYSGGDVWFTVVAPASGQLVLTGSTVGGSSLTDGAMALYSATACGGTYTQIACNDDSPLGGLMPYLSVSGLTSGTTYYVRFWEYGNNAFGQFNICATTPTAASNDDPCTATSLTVNASCTNTTSTTSGASNTAGISTPSCGNYLGNDVWFSVVVPASGRLTVSTSTVGGSSLTDAALALYSASACGSTMTEVGCNDNAPAGNMPSLSMSGLTAGATYYVRVWGAGNTAFGQFTICATEPPANDEPCGAISLTVGSSCTLASRTNVGATNTTGPPAPGCGSFTGSSGDVWYSFVVPSSGIAIIESTAGTLTDGSMALYYSATCTASSLTLVQCSGDEGLGTMPFLRFSDLVPGGTYYLRYWGTGSTSGTFNLCVWSPAMPAGDCVYLLELFDSGENGWGTSAVQVQINGGATVNHTVAASNFYNSAMIGLYSGDLLQVSYVNSGPNQSQNRYQIRQVPGGFGVLSEGPSPTNGITLLETADCTPPDPPNEDCRGSTSICDAQSFNDNPNGTGFDVDLRSTTFGCLASAERQGTWYKFSPSASGTIGLTITPSNNGDDYDFAVWGAENSVICPPYRQPKRCSYSGSTGVTGMRTSSTDTTESDSGDKWVAALSATAGEIYVMYISNFSQSGLSFSLSWQLTNGAALDCYLLPVDFIDLKADLLDENVEVQWSTATEENASHYIVERSTDAIEYVPIGTVQAMGNTSTLTTYTFLDEAPLEGLNYYRVQQVDMDGSSATSPADYAIYRKATTEMVVFPNPAGDILWASFEMLENDAVIWRILDAGGRLVEQDLYQGTKGNMLIDVPLDRLAPGSYTLLVNDQRGLMNRSAHFMKH